MINVFLNVDKNVAFKGKVVGGIRCRAPKNQPQAEPEIADEGIPF